MYPDPYTSTEYLLRFPQKILDIFSGAAHAMEANSAKLENWYLLEFIWDSLGRCKLVNNDYAITVTTNNKTDTIERLLPSQASLILGIWISPDDMSTLQTEKICKITARWEDRMQSGHIRRADA